MIEIFNTLLYEPILNALMYLVNILPGHDIGLAIIILTIIIKFILFWPSLSSIKSQRALQETQPKLVEIKKKYKDDKEELSRQLMKFYKENKVNPLSSCLPMLIQLPILFAVYRVFLVGLTIDSETGTLVAQQLEHLYGPIRDIFTSTPIDTISFGIIDLSKTGNYVLAILAGALQFVQSKMLMQKKPPKVPGAKDENMAVAMNKQMTYFFPLITVYIGVKFPAGLALYWVVMTLFSIGQQHYFFKKHPHQKLCETKSIGQAKTF